MSAGNSTTPLSPVNDPANWLPADFESTDNWKFVLSAAEIDDLLSMALRVRSRIGDDPNKLLLLDAAAFDLGVFAAKLKQIFLELRSGLGATLIKGLPIERLDLIDAGIIYWGIGLHLGVAAPNNPEGDIFGHITDLGKTQSDANSRGYQTREAMDYHCDQCDIVGLLCVRTAKQGGISKLASSVAMYNALLSENPHHVEVLSQPLYWTKHGEHDKKELPYYQSPVFNFLNGEFCTSFGPKHIFKGYDLPDTPDITEDLIQAIKRAEEIADELHVEMELEAGDMQFLNNYVSLHTRSAFVDYDDPTQKRLLWRLWLMNDNLRERTGYANQWLKGVASGGKQAQIRI